jgi:hypothetical protein
VAESVEAVGDVSLADSPNTILQTIADTILDITQCDSAGLSLLTRDGKTPDVCGQRFYWPAIAGMWNPHAGGGTPRNFGPCGDVLDQNRTRLFRHFERRYPYLMPVIPAAEECLLVPFYVGGEAVGTIWAIMHSELCDAVRPSSPKANVSVKSAAFPGAWRQTKSCGRSSSIASTGLRLAYQ